MLLMWAFLINSLAGSKTLFSIYTDSTRPVLSSIVPYLLDLHGDTPLVVVHFIERFKAHIFDDIKTM